MIIKSSNSFFNVFGLDASGTHVLVAAPGFGVLTNGKFTPLHGGLGHIEAAGWQRRLAAPRPSARRGPMS